MGKQEYHNDVYFITTEKHVSQCEVEGEKLGTERVQGKLVIKRNPMDRLKEGKGDRERILHLFIKIIRERRHRVGAVVILSMDKFMGFISDGME